MLSQSTYDARSAYQFDLHARYTTLAEILICALSAAQGPRILDVGAGPQRLTEEFLPSGFAAVTRTDVDTFGDEAIKLTGADGTLPFPDGEFDAVVAMDVLEHVKPAARDTFLAECVRVSKIVAVIAAPIGCEAVQAAERDYAAAYRQIFGSDEPFLVEHEAFGLPDAEHVRSVLAAAGATVVTCDNVRLTDWLALNVANLVLSTVNDGDAARSAVAGMQNAALATSEAGAQHYRRFFIAARDPQLARALAERMDASSRPAATQSADSPLVALAQEFKRYVTRYHGPTLEAVLADRDLSIQTLSDVVADKNRHIDELQAVADGLSEGLRANEQQIQQQAAALAELEQALQSARDALRLAEEALRRERDRTLWGRVRRLYARLRREARTRQVAG